jgi:hypothetical protein
MREVCEKLAIASADQREDILKNSRTPGKRSKTEPFKLTDFSSKKPVKAPATVDW